MHTSCRLIGMYHCFRFHLISWNRLRVLPRTDKVDIICSRCGELEIDNYLPMLLNLVIHCNQQISSYMMLNRIKAIKNNLYLPYHAKIGSVASEILLHRKNVKNEILNFFLLFKISFKKSGSVVKQPVCRETVFLPKHLLFHCPHLIYIKLKYESV